MNNPIDLKILSALIANGRATCKEISTTAGVSPQRVSQRMATLEDQGIIKGYKALLDYDLLGANLLALFLIKAQGPRIPKLVSLMALDPNLIAVFEVTGEYDIMALGRFGDRDEMNRRIKSLQKYPGIEGTNTSIILNIAKENGDPPITPKT